MQTDNDVSASGEPGEIDGLSLLLFRAGGVHFGVEAGQIASAMALADYEGEQPVWLHVILELGRQPADRREAVILEIKAAGALIRRVAVDVMEDLVFARFDEIFPLPPPVERHALRKGMWGVLPREGKMILLIDFRLLSELRKTGL